MKGASTTVQVLAVIGGLSIASAVLGAILVLAVRPRVSVAAT